MSDEHHSGTEIAVIGIVSRFPGAPDVETFWRNLRAGVESISTFSQEELRRHGIDDAALAHPRYVRARGLVEGAESFDAAFFGYSPREAEVMDPQHRLFLECAWQALETAGYASEAGLGPVGVFGSVGSNGYLLNNLLSRPDVMRTVGSTRAGIGADKDYLTTRVSYKLELTGPSFAVQTACSSSLVAVHLACQSLLNFECNAALAGGVAIAVPQRAGYWYEDGGIASSDGRCRAFSADASGTVFGDGVGIVVLRRSEDAFADGDHVLALIKGSAINNDGGARMGYTAPSIQGQSRVITEALAVADVAPDTVTLIEAHGTGTSLGDPIEMTALTEAFRNTGATGRGTCALGSVKTNVGHLAEAAGIAGLIKTVLALAHREIPPSLHFDAPSPQIDFDSSPFRVSTELRPWTPPEGVPRRAGVSSFGIGGTNAHVVLEEAPPELRERPASPSRSWQLLTLSAKSASALETAAHALARHLEAHPEQDLADVAHTLQVGRRAFSERRALVCRDRVQAIAALRSEGAARRATGSEAPDGGRPVAFLFPGQGAQRQGMLRDLYTEPVVARETDRASEILHPHLGRDLRDLLLAEPGGEEATSDELDRTALAQPALFVTELALARLWISWGIEPQSLLGHSIGEWVAACLAGVFSLEDALALVAARGRLMQELPRGAMLALRCSAEEAGRYLSGDLSLAASNGPAACTVSGPPAEIGALEGRLLADSIPHRRLRVSHAFHSPSVAPAADALEALVRRVERRPPSIPYLSNVTGTWITSAEATDPAYWARQLRTTVRFGDGLAELLARPELLLLEVGPGRSLAQLARHQRGPAEGPGIWSTLPGAVSGGGDAEADGLADALTALGGLWVEGAAIDWTGFRGAEERRRVPLPTYPFERRRHWIDPLPARERVAAAPAVTAPGVEPPAGVDEHEAEPLAAPPAEEAPALPPEAAELTEGIEERIAAIWRELLGVPAVAPTDDFFALGGDSLLGTQLIARIQETFPVTVPLQRVFEEPTLGRLAAAVRYELLRKLEEMSEIEAEQLA